VFDTIADFAANAGIVLGGRPVRPLDLDLRWVGAMLHKNGVIEETGLAAGVLNHPAMASPGWPTRSRRMASDVVLAGSFTRPTTARRRAVLAGFLHMSALILDFGGVISRTLFETHALSEHALGLPPGTLRWRGPFDPSTDAPWCDMQAGRPRAYLDCLATLGVPARDAVFVDDQGRNVQGALALGMASVHFDVTAPAASFRRALALLGVPPPESLALGDGQDIG
jgi:hypothetical protein